MYLYGASGHAKVIKEALESRGVKVLGLVDDNPQAASPDGVPVLHSAEGLSPMIVAVGDCAARRKITAPSGRRAATSAMTTGRASSRAGPRAMPGFIRTSR